MAQQEETKELRNFGLIVGGVFAVLGVWPLVVHGEPLRMWAISLGGALIGLGAVFPASLKQVHWAWMKIGHVLGFINTRIILGIVYYGVVTPMGVVMRILGKDSMHRTLVPESDTYRVVRPPRPRLHMKNPF
jgi:hypothetical protein